MMERRCIQFEDAVSAFEGIFTTGTSVVTNKLSVASYATLVLYLDVSNVTDEVGEIIVQHSPDGTNWFLLLTDPTVAITQAGLMIAQFNCYGSFMRIKITGASGTGSFTIATAICEAKS